MSDNLSCQIEQQFLEEDEFNHLNEHIIRDYQVRDEDVGIRLDKLAADVFEGFSRVQVQAMIDLGELTVNGQVQKPKYRVK